MSGRIQLAVVSIVIDGIRAANPAALDEELVARVLAADDGGVPLGIYRRLLDDALVRDSGPALLRCGESIRTLEHQHPLLFTLLNSDAPRVLLEKEARLAAFFHSRHRLVIEDETETSMRLRHIGPPGEPPEPAEDLVTCGQHIVLFEEIGCRDLRCRLYTSAAPRRWVYDRGEVEAPAPGGDYAGWEFEWQSFEPTRKPMRGLDEMLIALADDEELREDEGPIAEVERLVRRDLGKSWRLAEVAQRLGRSPRSLQRALASAGERYSELIDRVRNQEARRLLGASKLSVTEIGYLCGFADSAHFSRSFKKRYGHPPSAERRTSG